MEASLSLVQKLNKFLHKILGGNDLWKRSDRVTKSSMATFFGIVFIILSLSAIVITIKLPTAPFIPPDEMVEVPPKREKKYKIIFAENSDFILQVEKPKPKPIPKKKPPPPPPKPVEAVQQDVVIDPTLEDKIIGQLIKYVERNKQYPKQAQRMGIQGRNFISVTINANGQVSSADMTNASGNALLDNSTKELAKKVLGLQLPAPERSMTVRIPISYTFK